MDRSEAELIVRKLNIPRSALAEAGQKKAQTWSSETITIGIAVSVAVLITLVLVILGLPPLRDWLLKFTGNGTPA
jgi:hypothetical protein